MTPPPRGIRKVLPIPPLPSLTPHENIYTVPNLLTASRIVAAPFIGYAILHDAHAWALGLFVYAGVSDLLDGWIARRWNLHTVVGSIIDPMADKLLMTILTVCLATKGLLPGKCLSVFYCLPHRGQTPVTCLGSVSLRVSIAFSRALLAS